MTARPASLSRRPIAHTPNAAGDDDGARVASVRAEYRHPTGVGHKGAHQRPEPRTPPRRPSNDHELGRPRSARARPSGSAHSTTTIRGVEDGKYANGRARIASAALTPSATRSSKSNGSVHALDDI